MGKVAIQGHATRGKEVIEILEMLGGNNCKCLNGTETSGFYYIDDSGAIRNSRGAGGVLSITCFKLEEFLEKFPYKVGDKVEVSHPDDSTGILIDEIISMRWNGSEIRYEICDLDFRAEEIQPIANDLCYPKPESMEERKYSDLRLPLDDDDKLATEVTISGNKILPPNGYLIGKITQVDNGMLVEYVKKQPQYPKTYEECCRIVNANPYIRLKYDLSDGQKYSYDVDNLHFYENLRQLRICRDAYWKLTGNWEPDWEDGTPKYGLIVSGNRVKKQKSEYVQMKFCFPTEDILDAFCENFDKPINNCKEML